MKVKEENEKASLKLNVQKTKIMACSPIISRQSEVGKDKVATDFIFVGSKITVDGDCSHEILILASQKKSYDKRRQCIEKQRHHFTDKSLYNQAYGFSSSHLWM